MGFEGLGDSMRSSAVLLKKRARAKEEGRSRSHSMYPLFFMSYPPPETAHSLILKPKASEGSSMKIQRNSTRSQPRRQRIGNQIDAAFIVARADFVNVHR